MSLNYDEKFVQLLIAHQSRLRAFVRSLIPVKRDAEDVLQETNVVLCRKAGEYVDGTNFTAWVLQVAYFQVLSYRQSLARNRLVFEDDTVRELVDAVTERIQGIDDREEALQFCLGKLSRSQRQMLARRYSQGESVTKIAADMSRPIGSVRQSFFRIRALLQACIEQRLARPESC